MSVCVMMACGSDEPSTLRFGVADPTATVLHEFDGGDVLLALEGAHRRVRLNFTAATDELPGIACNWLRPASDGTELVRCANTYARTPGQPWQRIPVPDDTSELVGQAKDGTRYFLHGFTRAVVAQVPGADAFTPVTGFTTLEVSPYGDFLAVGPDAVRVLLRGELGPAIPLPQYPFGPPGALSTLAQLVDEAGFIYIRTATGEIDRYDLESGARDAAWFGPPGDANPSYRFLGVSSEGALFAISETNEGLSSGQRDNEIPVGTLMSRHRGDGDWQSAGALYGREYYAYEQPPQGWPGRAGTWWLSTCIANCAGNAGRPQKEIIRWQPSGTADVPPVPSTFAAYVDIGFAIATGAGSGELSFGDSNCEPVLGTDVFAVVYAVCHTPGRHTAVVGGRKVTIEVARAPAEPVPAPRRRTVVDLGSGATTYAYVGTDGLFHVFATGATPEDTALAQPGGVIALAPEHLLTADGAVYRCQSIGAPSATRVTVPPASAISGSFMVGTDGNVYRVADGATPIAGISGAVDLDCETLSYANTPRESCTVLGAAGRTWTFDKVGINVIELKEHPADPMLAAVTRAGGLSRTGQWYRRVDDTFWLEPSVLLDLTAATRTAHQSGTGNFYVPTAFMVTRGGEAWMSAFEGRNNFGVELPLDRTAVAIEPGNGGAFVWLDDGRLGFAELMSVQGGTGPVVWRPLSVAARPPGRE